MIYEKIKVTEILKEITDYAVEKYKEREKRKIDSNLDSYVQTIFPEGINAEENRPEVETDNTVTGSAEVVDTENKTSDNE